LTDRLGQSFGRFAQHPQNTTHPLPLPAPLCCNDRHSLHNWVIISIRLTRLSQTSSPFLISVSTFSPLVRQLSVTVPGVYNHEHDSSSLVRYLNCRCHASSPRLSALPNLPQEQTQISFQEDESPFYSTIVDFEPASTDPTLFHFQDSQAAPLDPKQVFFMDSHQLD
jgi:hypothetical protein